jgi:hypothetical protein
MQYFAHLALLSLVDDAQTSSLSSKTLACLLTNQIDYQFKEVNTCFLQSPYSVICSLYRAQGYHPSSLQIKQKLSKMNCLVKWTHYLEILAVVLSVIPSLSGHHIERLQYRYCARQDSYRNFNIFLRGNHSHSSGNTSGNYFTIGISTNSLLVFLKSTTYVK